MALFPPWSNSLLAWFLVLGGATLASVLVSAWFYVHGPLNTRQNEPVAQPVDFDHRHHVGDDGIDCRYCHYLAERSPVAGVPPVELCMNCHGQIWNEASVLEPVRHAYFSGQPLAWRRVSNVPDFVFFNHAIHVNRGVGCVTCHGRVDRMPEVHKDAPLTMQWCLDCHRNPDPALRPRAEMTSLDWVPKDPELGSRLRAREHIAPPTNCTGCHR